MFCSGTAYVLSYDAVQGIGLVSQTVPYLYFEDVYVALCANKSGLIPRNNYKEKTPKIQNV